MAVYPRRSKAGRGSERNGCSRPATVHSSSLQPSGWRVPSCPSPATLVETPPGSQAASPLAVSSHRAGEPTDREWSPGLCSSQESSKAVSMDHGRMSLVTARLRLRQPGPQALRLSLLSLLL